MFREIKRLTRALYSERKVIRFLRHGILPLFWQDRFSQRPLFIMSPASSGSTWIAGLLGNLQSHVFIHEVKLFGGPTRIGANVLMAMPAFITARISYILIESFQRARLWTLSSHSSHLGDRPEILSNQNLLPFDVAHPEGTNKLIDVINSAGSNLHIAPLLRRAYPNSILCYLLRDPRDVCASISHRKPFGNELSIEGWATLYAKTFRMLELYRSTCSIDVLRYEAWVSDAEGQLRAFLDRHRLPMSDVALRKAVFRHDAKAIRAGKTRRVGNLASGQSGTWKRDLSIDEQRAIKRVLGGMLTEIGYDADDEWESI